MRCPKCSNNHPYKFGMKCGSCGYVFALSPKSPPYVTDMAMKKLIEKLSMGKTFYFTFNQLLSQVVQMIRKKRKKNRLIFSIVIAVVSAIIVLILLSSSLAVAVLFVVICFAGIVLMNKQTVKIPMFQVIDLINTYKAEHPIENLVDGKRLENLAPDAFNAEFLQYAPERILISQRNDIVDMMVLNKFHFQHKTLVVSAFKYPKCAYDACRRFLKEHPDIPVIIIHDASKEGLTLSTKLLNDSSWGLNPHTVQDLGLNPEDIDNIKVPTFIPEMRSHEKNKHILSKGSADDMIEKGYKMPIDIAMPSRFNTIVALAVVSGAALFSHEMAAHHAAAGTTGEGDFDFDFE